MRPSIFVLSVVTIALLGCTVDNPPASIDANTLSSSSTPTATSVSDPPFLGEPAHLVDEASSTPVTVRAEPADQASAVATVSVDEVVRVIDSTRDEAQRMWYQVQQTSGATGWVMGQFIQFIQDSDPLARPMVVMPGGMPILAEPGNDAPVIGQVQGGEVLAISRLVEVPELDDRKSTWLEIDRGWVSAEFVFQPACLRFNGNLMRVVNIEGAVLRAEPSNQAQAVDRLEGGETVVPVSIETNAQGEWLQTEQGWVNNESLFLPTCQNSTL